MEIIKILVLAVLQGIAEFLPISSSSHILIVGNFLGIDSVHAESTSTDLVSGYAMKYSKVFSAITE